jgi:uncharacterized protein
MPSKIPEPDQSLVHKVIQYVEQYMNSGNFDGSHDFNHVKRVLGLSHLLYSEITKSSATEDGASANPQPKLDLTIITLGALLHDVGDKKYLKEGQDDEIMVRDLLLSFGADPELAQIVQTICLGVSYRSEIKSPGRVEELIRKHPELAVVQDADRLDAIGAVGIGRVFTYGGARTKRGMDQSIEIMEDKLLKLEALMKTVPGKRLAKQRTDRLKTFREWWFDEVEVGELCPTILKPGLNV